MGVVRATDGYIPFAIRFKAWWEGLDPEALVARPDDNPGANPLAIEVDSPEDETPEVRWTESRVAFCRRLWEDTPKDEVVNPGGATKTYELMKPMGLSASCSAADLSAGLGGGTRRAAIELGTYVDGFEPDAELADLGARLSREQGMGRKADIQPYEHDRLELQARKYTGILCRERVFRFARKKLFIEQCATALKPGGHLIITDLNAQPSTQPPHPAVGAWKAREPNPVDLWTPDEMTSTMARLGMDVRIKKDETDAYRSSLLKGWARFVEGLERPDLTRGFVNEMMREAECWLMLIRALESGDLRYYRYHAIRSHVTR
jgi:SAM-dependent methyltransferase